MFPKSNQEDEDLEVKRYRIKETSISQFIQRLLSNPQNTNLVRLRCGSKVEVADIDEPSRCEYSALLTTPALCQEGRLKELQDKLEVVKMERPQGNNLVKLEVKNTWISVNHMNQMLMIRKVDPTLDMEADEGDYYTHIPVRNKVG
ncbi:unnamed protein product [Lactuca saligna]|uniref:Glucosidase 2 subunit beta-like domain-containing protein n=1 Tax=Lactuca saligna TaxID=75948 RepID=A0AA35Z3W8_LACSI|nr:unnamed protein product [Lactuca saligna]